MRAGCLFSIVHNDEASSPWLASQPKLITLKPAQHRCMGRASPAYTIGSPRHTHML